MAKVATGRTTARHGSYAPAAITWTFTPTRPLGARAALLLRVTGTKTKGLLLHLTTPAPTALGGDRWMVTTPSLTSSSANSKASASTAATGWPDARPTTTGKPAS